MRTSREIRNEAWATLWKGGWFWKLFAVSVLLGAISFAAVNLVQIGFSVCGITDLTAHLDDVREAKRAGAAVPVLSAAGWIRAVGATLFAWFISMIFIGCSQFGNVTVQLKAARGRAEDWMGGVFGGYLRPFGILAQILLQALFVVVGLILLVVPGVIAAFRYRQAMYVRADRPDWSASACLRESARLMDGAKWRSFVLDLSFIGCYVLVFVIALVFGGLASVGASPAVRAIAMLGALVVFLVFLAVCAVLGQYIGLAHAVFYRDLVNEKGLPE